MKKLLWLLAFGAVCGWSDVSAMSQEDQAPRDVEEGDAVVVAATSDEEDLSLPKKRAKIVTAAAKSKTDAPRKRVHFEETVERQLFDVNAEPTKDKGDEEAQRRVDDVGQLHTRYVSLEKLPENVARHYMLASRSLQARGPHKTRNIGNAVSYVRQAVKEACKELTPAEREVLVLQLLYGWTPPPHSDASRQQIIDQCKQAVSAKLKIMPDHFKGPDGINPLVLFTELQREIHRKEACKELIHDESMLLISHLLYTWNTPPQSDASIQQIIDKCKQEVIAELETMPDHVKGPGGINLLVLFAELQREIHRDVREKYRHLYLRLKRNHTIAAASGTPEEAIAIDGNDEDLWSPINDLKEIWPNYDIARTPFAKIRMIVYKACEHLNLSGIERLLFDLWKTCRSTVSQHITLKLGEPVVANHLKTHRDLYNALYNAMNEIAVQILRNRFPLLVNIDVEYRWSHALQLQISELLQQYMSGEIEE